MAGSYGDSSEDKHFEGLLLNHIEGEVLEEEAKKFTELDLDVIDLLIDFMNGDKITDDASQIMEDIVIPMLEILDAEGIDSEMKLKRHITKTHESNKLIKKIKESSDQMEYFLGRIVDLTKE